MRVFAWLKNASLLFGQPSLVLMYHRVATLTTDPWELAVCPQFFEQQLQVLQKTGLVAPISQLIEQVLSKKIQKPFIILTFDDGYADNYLLAKPLLEKYGLPATFFITSKHLGQEKEFWWDELENILLHTESLTRYLSLCLQNISFDFDLQDEEILTETLKQKHCHWNAYLEPPTRRSKLYLELWQLLSPLSYAEQQHLLAALRQWAGITECPRTSYLPMLEAQLRELATHELFTIGGHTVSHPALAHHPAEIQRHEIAQNKELLEALTGSTINSFAYPSGNYNNTTIDIIRQQGIQIAFTTQHQVVKEKDDPYQIGRFQINNWPGTVFERMLSKWI